MAADFDGLRPLSVDFEIQNYAEIRLFIANDQITLEYNDRVTLVYTPSNRAIIPGIEAAGEYVRSVATVNIIDNDRKFHTSTTQVLLALCLKICR